MKKLKDKINVSIFLKLYFYLNIEEGEKMKKIVLLILIFLIYTTSVFSAWYEKENFDKHLEEKDSLLLVFKGHLEPSYASFGILKYASEENIKIDAILAQGFSIISSLLYASGYSSDDIDKILTEYRIENMIKVRVPLHQSLLETHMAVSYFKHFIPYSKIEELPIGFAYVSRDLVKNEDVIISGGKIEDALRAAFSYPILGNLLLYKGRALVDAGSIDLSLLKADKIVLFNLENDNLDENLNNPLVVFSRLNSKPIKNLTDNIVVIDYKRKAQQLSYLNFKEVSDDAYEYIKEIAKDYKFKKEERKREEYREYIYEFDRSYSDKFDHYLTLSTIDYQKKRYLDPSIGLGVLYKGYVDNFSYDISLNAGYRSLISYYPFLYADIDLNYAPVKNWNFNLANSYILTPFLDFEIYALAANELRYKFFDSHFGFGYKIAIEHLYKNKKIEQLFSADLYLNYLDDFDILKLELLNTISYQATNFFNLHYLSYELKANMLFDFNLYTNLGFSLRAPLNSTKTPLYIKDNYNTTNFDSYMIMINSPFYSSLLTEIGYLIDTSSLSTEVIQMPSLLIGAYANTLFDISGFYAVSVGGSIGFRTTVLNLDPKEYKISLGYESRSKKVQLRFDFSF